MKFKNIKRIASVMLLLMMFNSFITPVCARDIDVPEGVPLPSNFGIQEKGGYEEITSDRSKNAVDLWDSYEESIGMKDEEALQFYKEYLASSRKKISDKESYSIRQLNDFAEYAVKKGIINDTAKQRAGITKAVVRAEFKAVVVAGKALGLTTSAKLLNHSLQDRPKNLSYGSSTKSASQILKSSECKKIVKNFKAYVKRKKLSGRMTSGSIVLNSTRDLHLSYNKVSYVASGTKSKGKWNLTITFTDTYDFEMQAWKNAMTGNPVVTVLNNYGAYAQSIKAIVPYKVKVTVKTSFKQ